MSKKTVTFTIEGTDALERKLLSMGNRVFAELDGIVKKATEPLVKAAKARVPRDRGTLRDSIHASKAFGRRGTVEYHVGPGKDGFYGRLERQ